MPMRFLQQQRTYKKIPASRLPRLLVAQTLVRFLPTAAPMVDPEWTDQLKNMEISPLVKYLLCTVVKQRARALHARNNVLESHPEEIAPNWPY
ncbi:hypothetical protein NL676_010178 [Syzygium grande]|nr:hypothetical protein NL676_010178 [Syzygium grande]